MVVADLSNVAAALRQEGYEARNLGQVGVTVWKDGQGVFFFAEELQRLNGNISREVARRTRKAPCSSLPGTPS